MDENDKHGHPLWPAAERNKQPILEELNALLPKSGGILLEISSGTGQHALHFARALPHFRYQMTDTDPAHLETLRARHGLSQLTNLAPPLRLDVTEQPWPVDRADVVYNANMIHIAPPAATAGLFSGVGRILATGGILITYGPYRVEGQHTSESNERFDASLKSRDANWGLRDLNDLMRLASSAGINYRKSIQMPANNFLVVWDKA